MKNTGLALVLAVAACGGGTSDGKLSNHPQATQTVSVGLLGVNASGPVRVRVASLELAIDGQALPVQATDEELELGTDQNARIVANLELGADEQNLAINLKFEPEGTVERNGKTQVLNLGGPPLSLVADAAQMRARSHVVLEIDLARSLVDQGEQVFLLPTFVVRY
jgi:hypothetical protein